ncbi:MAG: 3'(2'),5'-bisphosphate nucleotidase CysQ [Candidatus Woesearchaeota archaeon]|nr:MAG: 3'(2'),5'-bisphosphate nucleotidase CysQ [Candidatus Woesearchaeota archaeon]
MVTAQDIIPIAREAGKRILSFYRKESAVLEEKSDGTFVSPLTEADLAANTYIVAALTKLDPTIPIISEEVVATPFAERKHWTTFWCVDPLDGTKEFIKGRDEFTVNIGLIKDGTPILGVIYAPALDILYYADAQGAYKQVGKDAPVSLPLSLPAKDPRMLVVVTTKSHMNDATRNFLGKLEREGNTIQTTAIGSSLKFCLVAEGTADLYPRYGPVMEWDTAAAHAILLATGKQARLIATGEVLSYNKEDLHQQPFMVK